MTNLDPEPSLHVSFHEARKYQRANPGMAYAEALLMAKNAAREHHEEWQQRQDNRHKAAQRAYTSPKHIAHFAECLRETGKLTNHQRRAVLRAIRLGKPVPDTLREAAEKQQ